MRFDPRRVYYTLHFFMAISSFTAFTASAVYAVMEAGLSPLQLVLVGTVLEATVLLCEVPTGVLADVYSRRLSILIGLGLIGIGFITWGMWPRFEIILIGQFLWGLGYTFTSGATQAWIADEIAPDDPGPVLLRGAQRYHIGAALGIPIGVAIGWTRPGLAIVAGGIGYLVLCVYLIFAMSEHGFTRGRNEDGSEARFLEILRKAIKLIRAHPLLVAILLIGMFYGMSTEGFDRLRDAHLLRNFKLPFSDLVRPIVWMGAMAAIGSLLSFVATGLVRNRVDTQDVQAISRAMLCIDLSLIASGVLFGLAGGFVFAISAIWLTILLRSARGPLDTVWINQNLSSDVRATVLSIRGQADALGQVLGGPIIGLIGSVYSISNAILFASLTLVPAMILYAWIMRSSNRPPPGG